MHSIYIFHSCPESLFECLSVRRENVASEYANVAWEFWFFFQTAVQMPHRTPMRFCKANPKAWVDVSGPRPRGLRSHDSRKSMIPPLDQPQAPSPANFHPNSVPALTYHSLPLRLSWARLGCVRVPPPLCLLTRRNACPNVAVNEKIDDVRVISWIYYRAGKFQAIRVDAPFLSARNVTITASFSVGFPDKSRINDNKRRFSLF